MGSSQCNSENYFHGTFKVLTFYVLQRWTGFEIFHEDLRPEENRNHASV